MGAGRIGSHLIADLLVRGSQVIVLDAYNSASSNRDLEVVQDDSLRQAHQLAAGSLAMTALTVPLAGRQLMELVVQPQGSEVAVAQSQKGGRRTLHR